MAQTPDPPALDPAHDPALRRRLGQWAALDWRQYVIYAGFVIVFLVFAVMLRDQGFLQTTNLLNILRQSATIAVMAVAMTFVLSAGQIDLSVGSVAGLASVTTALAISHWGLLAGIVAGLATGAIVGTINGWLTAHVGIPAFLVTLAMLGIASGTARWISDTAAIPILDQNYTSWFGSGDLGPIPSLALWLLVVGVVGHVALRNTSFGRRVLATGGNPGAARFSGINTKAVTRQVLLMSGMAAALGGMLYAGRLHSGRFQFGEGDELSVIAAVVLGGTRLFGGKGTVVGSIIGALIIGLINNGLTLMGLDFSQQQIVRGAIIILAVAAGRRRE